MNQFNKNFNGDVARIEDLPYFYSPPMQFTFTQSATLTLGQYPFVGDREEVGNNKNITDNTMMFIKAITFTADIPEIDYQQALQLTGGTNVIPNFSLFLTSDSNAPILTDPIQLGSYFNDQEYKKIVYPKQFPNILSGFFRGTLQQTGALAGVNEINLTMNMWVQAITDDAFIESVKRAYPQTNG